MECSYWLHIGPMRETHMGLPKRVPDNSAIGQTKGMTYALWEVLYHVILDNFIWFKEMFHMEVKTRMCSIIKDTWVLYGQTHILPRIQNKALFTNFNQGIN